MVARVRTSEVGCCRPDLAIRYELLVLLVHDTHTEEAVTTLAEEGRLCILDHAFLCKDILPGLVAREVIEVGSCLLAEVATTHLHAADILQVVELGPLLFLCIAEGLDGFVGIILAQ